MPTQESNITKEILLEASRNKTILFRNNTGTGWIGERIHYPKPGYVLLKNARPLEAGLTKGGSDLIGWKMVEITPDMLGRKFAIFTAIEVKTESGRASQNQLNFISQVRAGGGVAGIARSADEARNLLQSYL
jgi:hypothetical protein